MFLFLNVLLPPLLISECCLLFAVDAKGHRVVLVEHVYLHITPCFAPSHILDFPL